MLSSEIFFWECLHGLLKQIWCKYERKLKSNFSPMEVYSVCLPLLQNITMMATLLLPEDHQHQVSVSVSDWHELLLILQ